MAMKLKDREISAMLDSNSDSDIQKTVNKTAVKSRRRRDSQLQSNTKRNSQLQNDTINISDDEISDTENMFDRVKHLLSRKNDLQKEKASLRIKLRRSTEQSLYKIDTDSECERPVRKSRGGALRKSKKNSTDVGSDVSHSDSKNNSVRNRSKHTNEFTQSQDENETPQRSNRIKRPPLRYSYYQCGTLPSLNHSVNSPSLRNKKSINYNEEQLFLLSVKNNEYEEKKRAEKKKVVRKEEKNYDSDSSTTIHNSESKVLNSITRNNKRNRTISVKDNEIDSDTTSKVIKPKSPKKSNTVTNSTSNRIDCSSDIKTEITKKQGSLRSLSGNVTPTRRAKQKRSTSESTTKNREPSTDINENHSEEEYIADVNKRVRNSSTKRNIATPKKTSNMQKSPGLLAEKNEIQRTPKSRALKCSNLTPSMGKRSSILLKPSTPLQQARSRLHVSAVPKSLPCREEEFNDIFTFLKGKLVDKTGGCMYISGVPGTGKTATVNEVVRCLEKLISKGELDDFDYVAINGMKLTEPRQSYVQILKQLTGQTVTWEQAYRTLEKRFHTANSKMTLLLVDELDFLCTKRQDVVYNLLDWPTKASAQLVVITIANTMDLPERVLMGRVTSRLGLTRLTFQPYNHKQLQEIVVTRLKGFDAFRSEAIQLVARKVSAVSGDARRALDICRRAMEIAESRDAETISLQDVTQAVSEMIASAKIQAIKHCSKMEQIFLQAVSAEVTRTSIEEVYFRDAYKQLESLCSFDGIRIPTTTEILAVCARLGSSRLLICEHSRNDVYQKILLNVSTDDIHYALQELDLNKK